MGSSLSGSKPCMISTSNQSRVLEPHPMLESFPPAELDTLLSGDSLVQFCARTLVSRDNQTRSSHPWPGSPRSVAAGHANCLTFPHANHPSLPGGRTRERARNHAPRAEESSRFVLGQDGERADRYPGRDSTAAPGNSPDAVNLSSPIGRKLCPDNSPGRPHGFPEP